VSTHKARILEKMGMDSVADLVRYAMVHKLIDVRGS
jgi:DNA-binding CsgD family transcriptional regulator